MKQLLFFQVEFHLLTLKIKNLTNEKYNFDIINDLQAFNIKRFKNYC